MLADHIAAGGRRQVCVQITLRQGAGGRRRQAVQRQQILLARAPTAPWPDHPPTRSLGGPLALHELRCQPALRLRGREGWLLGVQANEHAWQEGRGRPISEQTQAARWQHMPGEPPAIPRLTGFIAAMELEWVVSSRILDKLKSWLRGVHRGSGRGGKWV